jgi:phosphate/sulfate permease
MSLLIVIIILALLFDYINGFHDAANSIATVVSTKVLTPFQAVLWAALFNCVAFWIFKDHAVANTISKTVFKEFITLQVILAGLIAAIIWNLLTWWYGIPSSSSHTLIGGFAGAAITHGLITQGTDISWAKIVDSETIIKTVLFIFFAPLIGMFISIFITIVTIYRNIWIRLAIITVVTIITVLIFDKFEEKKMDEGLQKFIKLDKYKADYTKALNLSNEKSDDSTLKQSLTTAKDKLDKATVIYGELNPLISNFDQIGADSIANYASRNGLLQDIGISKLKDEVRNANNFLILEALSVENNENRKEYDLAKNETEKYKVPLKKYLKKEITLDSALMSMNSIYPIANQNISNQGENRKIRHNSVLQKRHRKIRKSCDSLGHSINITPIYADLLVC